MAAPYKIGDIVKPKPNYERCPTVCGQCCKHKTEKSWLYHFLTLEESALFITTEALMSWHLTISDFTEYRLKCLKKYKTTDKHEYA